MLRLIASCLILLRQIHFDSNGADDQTVTPCGGRILQHVQGQSSHQSDLFLANDGIPIAANVDLCQILRLMIRTKQPLTWGCAVWGGSKYFPGRYYSDIFRPSKPTTQSQRAGGALGANSNIGLRNPIISTTCDWWLGVWNTPKRESQQVAGLPSKHPIWSKQNKVR